MDDPKGVPATHGKKKFQVGAKGWPTMPIYANDHDAAIHEWQLAVNYAPKPDATDEDAPQAVEVS